LKKGRERWLILTDLLRDTILGICEKDPISDECVDQDIESEA